MSRIIAPQQGFQMQYLSSGADIVIGGAAAGVGKTFALLMDACRHLPVPRYEATFFRKTYPQIKAAGGLWSESIDLYASIGGKPNFTDLKWTFPGGSSIKFSSLEHESSVMNYQGAQMPWIGIDELTQFTEYSFFYLIGRNRTAIPVKPKIRATCNPDPDSFVASLIRWWIDSDGFPIRERAGVPRYFIRQDGTIIWGATKQELIERYPGYFKDDNDTSGLVSPADRIKSLTFIPGSIYDNKKLLQVNPEYLGNLHALDDESKQRYLYGNWKVKLDSLCLCTANAIDDMFDTTRTTDGHEGFITCDASGHGRDFTVIFVWRGWTVIDVVIMRITDGPEIHDEIERLRQKHNIVRRNVAVDSDGVGNHTVKRGNYTPFHGGRSPMYNREAKKTENYYNLKTQCYYLVADKINRGELTVKLYGDNCHIDGIQTRKMKVKGLLMDVSELIKQDLRAIKRKDNGDGKISINTKDDQKAILGRSPDFSDTLMMRVLFFLRPVHF